MEILPAPDPVLAVDPQPDNQLQAESPALVESSLPDSFHDCYRLKLAGTPVNEIATRMGICRETVWRRCRAVEREFADQLSKSPQYNILALEIKRLIDIEEQARSRATTAKTDRSAVMALDVARKAAESRQKLLLEAGVISREPTRMFQAIVNVKQPDRPEDQPTMSRDEAIERLIQKMRRTTPDLR